MVEIFNLVLLAAELAFIDFLFSFAFSQPLWTFLFFLIILITFLQTYRVFAGIVWFKKDPSKRVSLFYLALLGGSVYWTWTQNNPLQEKYYQSGGGQCFHVLKPWENEVLKKSSDQKFIKDLQDICRVEKLRRLFLQSKQSPSFCSNYKANTKFDCFKNFIEADSKKYPFQSELGLQLLSDALNDVSKITSGENAQQKDLASLLMKLSPAPLMKEKFLLRAQALVEGKELSPEEMADFTNINYRREIWEPFLKDAKEYFGF